MCLHLTCKSTKSLTRNITGTVVGNLKHNNTFINSAFVFVLCFFFYRSLMIGWRKNSWNPERVPTIVTFVCVCLSVCMYVCMYVRSRAIEHTFWPRNLIFELSDPWDMRKKRIFFLFRNVYFYAFYKHFSIVSLCNTSKFLVSCYRSQLFT